MKPITFALAVSAAASLLPLGLGAEIPMANTIKVPDNASRAELTELAAHVVPTPNQLDALEDGFIAFIHFGPNTFTRREWGTGFEKPEVFDLKTLDTDQWVHSMKEAGMKKVILTVKHHDGFVIYNSRYTDHGIMSTPFENGQGDVLRELSKSCQKYGMKLGIYLSPADLYQIENPDGLYGNLSPKTKRVIPRPVPGRPLANDSTKFEFVVDDYNEYFLNQLFELLTEYGPVHEVWFDGAHPKRKGGQTYNYAAWKELIHKLAPQAVIFGREDVRWCGNEAGGTRPTERNVVGYMQNPDTASVFLDMTDADLGSLDALAGKPYLHYQPAETNTSIREGWFYRDDDRQRTRSADDVFDMYERAVGGNSIFLLNIPPNREGRFSPQDVEVLAEVGKRIRETYTNDLLKGADAPAALLDNDIHTFVSAASDIDIMLPQPVTINRFMIQEPVADRSERIDSIQLWSMAQNGECQMVAAASNVGFKRILRFPDITTSSLRVRVVGSRLEPFIAQLSAYYYAARPPRLTSERSADGLVIIYPPLDAFGWKRSGDNPASNLTAGAEIFYTTDGSRPTAQSTRYTAPFKMGDGELRAVSVLHGEEGPVHIARYGYIKSGWNATASSDTLSGHGAALAFDSNPSTYWSSPASASPELTINLGQKQEVSGIIYTPQTADTSNGMIARGTIEVSPDGKKWSKASTFEFGNLINDPSPREYLLPAPVKGQFVRIRALEIAGNGDAASIAELEIF